MCELLRPKYESRYTASSEQITQEATSKVGRRQMQEKDENHKSEDLLSLQRPGEGT